MREVKKQRRNWAGMSSHNINKHETELGNIEHPAPTRTYNENDLNIFSEEVAPLPNPKIEG